tara:strand:- start:1103 stop:1924 length:822 start_codon:yes stop_codon:yes gene_type:complete
MRHFFKSRKEMVFLLIVLTGHLLVISSQLQNNTSTPLLRAWTMEFILPFLKTTITSTRLLSNAWKSYVQIRFDKQQFENLKKQQAIYRQTLINYEEQLRKIKRINLLTQIQVTLKSSSVKASVIGGDGSSGYRSRVLDKGSNAGIKKNSAVINLDGIVGRILHVSYNSSVVQLISDLDSGVGVLLEKSRAQGVLKGIGEQIAYVDYVSINEKTVPGERVLTSGLDQIYPKGLLVGIVLSAKKERGTLQQIEVSLSSQMQKLEEVLILTKESTG